MTVNQLLDSLPLELVEDICQPITLRDRVAWTSCCRTLWARVDITASLLLWATVEISAKELGNLHAWLARRCAAVRHLRLHLQQQPPSLPPVPASRFARPLCSKLEAALLQLAFLQHLDLRWCGLQRVPPALGALRCLLCLRLCGNPALGRSATGTMAVAEGQKQQPQQFSGQHDGPRAAGQLEGGKGSDTTPSSSESVFAPLSQLTTLTRLGLGDCDLSRLPRELASLVCLAGLDLQGNAQLGARPYSQSQRAATGATVAADGNFREQGGSSSSSSSFLAPLEPLRHLTSLTQLSLRACHLDMVPPELEALRSLRDLDLSCTLTPEEGGSAQLQPLSALSALNRLAISRGMVPKRRLPAPLPALVARGAVEWQY
ncbi:hypothetical protein N2152v2_000944 [Parachlorella kessleri]